MALLFFSACSKDDSESDFNGNAFLSVRLTDAPASYEEVLINIEDVMIHYTPIEGQGSWQSLENVHTGTYNLLDFTNGLDTLLAEQELPAGTVSQIRLILGDGNMVKVDGEYFDMATPSANTSGLKLNLNSTFEEGFSYTLWIDFDAGRSIVKRGNGTYSLKPVIRAYTESKTGAISGVVSPPEAKPYVMAISESNDTTGTYADTLSGKFILSGLEAGIYAMKFMPVEMYAKDSLSNVEVLTGEVTPLDTLFFDLATP